MIGLALLMIAAASDGSPYSGSDGIYKACLAPEKSIGRAYCEGFIDGALEGDFRRQHQGVCAPAGTTRQQFYDATISYLKSSPPKPAYDKFMVVIYALSIAYPCPVVPPQAQ